MINVIDQLYDVYIKEEWWHCTYLKYEDFLEYTKKLIDQGNLFYELDGEKLVGYTEIWLISFEQFGRIICGEKLSAFSENVLDGNIAYVANVWCKADYRRSDVIKTMKAKFFEKTMLCDYFVGEAKRKKTQPVKVFKREDILKLNKSKTN